ncbi:Ubiquitination Target receptor [Teratosphaeria destructans]|uniref:Ubiquitination Target receptor n=1 Tax=Teratosphaeria destructans TaxID=418781 RepID=A0A9W7SIN1_9PEZI|nr:Ubiquitination Target receptor [Teratosphaeria destructans]
MDNSLERVTTVQQTSMGFTRLPLELQQQVFSFLDTKSFHAARRVCKWWRYASLDTVTLSKQLQKLPILPPVDVAHADPRVLHRVFNEAAYNLMLGMRIQRESHKSGEPRAQRQVSGPQVTTATNGCRTVTLNGRTLALFDTSGEKPVCLAQRPLNDLKETVGNGPWLRVMPTAYCEMALSSNGNLLAIAQERTIQIYDMTAEADSYTVNECISSAAGHYICGLDFEQNDHLLRVRLSGKGTVLYLGSPAVESAEPASIEHWKSKAGLRHVFLNTSTLSIPVKDSTGDIITRVAGLQLLKPFQNGYLFAAQQHGGNTSGHYILGHIRHSMPPTSHVLTVEPGGVTILAKLESFLSAWSYTLNGIHEGGAGMWENMPSAHEHHPTFVLSKAANVLVLAERDKKAVRPSPLTGLYAYRVPSEESMVSMLEEDERQKRVWEQRSEVFDEVGSGNGKDEDTDIEADGSEQKYSVARIPLCLSTVQGVVTDMRFEQLEQQPGRAALALIVETADMTRVWTLNKA